MLVSTFVTISFYFYFYSPIVMHEAEANAIFTELVQCTMDNGIIILFSGVFVEWFLALSQRGFQFICTTIYISIRHLELCSFLKIHTFLLQKESELRKDYRAFWQCYSCWKFCCRHLDISFGLLNFAMGRKKGKIRNIQLLHQIQMRLS